MKRLSFEQSELPDLLRFDGFQHAIGEAPALMQFTELDRSAASYGASFYLAAASEPTVAAVSQRREEKRIEFADAEVK